MNVNLVAQDIEMCSVREDGQCCDSITHPHCSGTPRLVPVQAVAIRVAWSSTVCN